MKKNIRSFFASSDAPMHICISMVSFVTSLMRPARAKSVRKSGRQTAVHVCILRRVGQLAKMSQFSLGKLMSNSVHHIWSATRHQDEIQWTAAFVIGCVLGQD